MEYLELSFGREFVLSEEDLAQVKLLPRLPRPIHLDLSEPFQEKMSDFQIKLVADLLRYHPEVRLTLIHYMFREGHYGHKTEFWYTVDLNWHGRYLLDRPKVPLSIWPLVLEKVNVNRFLKDEASVIYGLLKGPAGAGRTSFERRVD